MDIHQFHSILKFIVELLDVAGTYYLFTLPTVILKGFTFDQDPEVTNFLSHLHPYITTIRNVIIAYSIILV